MDIINLQRRLLQQPRLKKDVNILNYWEKEKTKFPELYELVTIVHAVSATQVSVERSFSSLKFILSLQRSNITDQELENVLMIRNNHLFTGAAAVNK